MTLKPTPLPRHSAADRARRTYLFSVAYTTGAVMAVPASVEVAERYGALHEILPDGLTRWSASQLDDLLLELDGDDIEAWQRVLILLAHHKSGYAHQLIGELREQAPPDLEEFAELAYAESIGWLGFDYIREEGQAQPVIRPASGAGLDLVPHA